MSNKPVKTFKSSLGYSVNVAVWEHDGKLTASVQKRYKDKGGNYVEGKTYFTNELAALRDCCTRAIDYMDQFTEQNWATRGGNETDTANDTATAAARQKAMLDSMEPLPFGMDDDDDNSTTANI